MCFLDLLRRVEVCPGVPKQRQHLNMAVFSGDVGWSRTILYTSSETPLTLQTWRVYRGCGTQEERGVVLWLCFLHLLRRVEVCPGVPQQRQHLNMALTSGHDGWCHAIL